MNFANFLRRIDRLGFGVASFNTYHEDGCTRCFILVAANGDDGRFLKRECPVADLEATLLGMHDDLTEAT